MLAIGLGIGYSDGSSSESHLGLRIKRGSNDQQGWFQSHGGTDHRDEFQGFGSTVRYPTHGRGSRERND